MPTAGPDNESYHGCYITTAGPPEAMLRPGIWRDFHFVVSNKWDGEKTKIISQTEYIIQASSVIAPCIT